MLTRRYLISPIYEIELREIVMLNRGCRIKTTCSGLHGVEGTMKAGLTFVLDVGRRHRMTEGIDGRVQIARKTRSTEMQIPRMLRCGGMVLEEEDLTSHGARTHPRPRATGPRAALEVGAIGRETAIVIAIGSGEDGDMIHMQMAIRNG